MPNVTWFCQYRTVCINCGSDPLVRSRRPRRLALADDADSVGEKRVQGDPRGPGGPPHNLCRIRKSWENQVTLGIQPAMSFFRLLGRQISCAEPLSVTILPYLFPLLKSNNLHPFPASLPLGFSTPPCNDKDAKRLPEGIYGFTNGYTKGMDRCRRLGGPETGVRGNRQPVPGRAGRLPEARKAIPLVPAHQPDLGGVLHGVCRYQPHARRQGHPPA